MKKLLFVLSFVICGVAVTLGGKKNISGQVSTSEKPQIFKSEVPSEIKLPAQPELPLAEELEDQYERLSLKEVDQLIHKIETSETTAQLISKANKGELSDEDKAELTKIIRTKAALIKLAFDKKYEELELL